MEPKHTVACQSCQSCQSQRETETALVVNLNENLQYFTVIVWKNTHVKRYYLI